MKLIVEFMLFAGPAVIVFLSGFYLPFRYRRHIGILQIMLWLIISVFAGVLAVAVCRHFIFPNEQPAMPTSVSIHNPKSVPVTEEAAINIPALPKIITIKMRARATTYIRIAPATDAKVVRVLNKNEIIIINKVEGQDWAKVAESEAYINTLWLDNVDNLSSAASLLQKGVAK